MDLTVQAMSGVMASTGFPDRPPVKAGAALCDFFGAVHLFGAAVAALADVHRGGKGRFVEVAMMEAVFPSLSSQLGLYHSLGNSNPPRTGNRHGGLAESPYNVYPAADGWIAMFCVSEAHFVALATAMEQPDLPGDARFVDLAARVAHMDELDELISAWTSRHSKAELSEITSRLRVPCSPVREIDEVVNDPHMHERGALKRVDHPELGEVVLTAGPLRYGDAELRDIKPSRAVGADNATVFKDMIGLDDRELAALVAAGAV
jgi:crotonobetainyl-CoA:carnitine CoA-transferase CaiB-like acyl-CoA transferase